MYIHIKYGVNLLTKTKRQRHDLNGGISKKNMAEKKTTFQNWVDNNYPIGKRHELAKRTEVRENQITRDYRNPNGLKMIEKYLKKLKKKSVDLHGWEYGMYIELKNVKIV